MADLKADPNETFMIRAQIEAHILLASAQIARFLRSPYPEGKLKTEKADWARAQDSERRLAPIIAMLAERRMSVQILLQKLGELEARQGDGR